MNHPACTKFYGSPWSCSQELPASQGKKVERFLFLQSLPMPLFPTCYAFACIATRLSSFSFDPSLHRCSNDKLFRSQSFGTLMGPTSCVIELSLNALLLTLLLLQLFFIAFLIILLALLDFAVVRARYMQQWECVTCFGAIDPDRSPSISPANG